MAEKVKGKTASGFKFAIDEDVFKDWRFLQAIRKANNGTAEEQLDAGFELVSHLFNDQKEEERFYSFLAKQNGGRVPADVVGTEVGEIMKIVKEANKAAKN